MKKQIIAVVGMVVFAATGWAQSSDMQVAALNPGTGRAIEQMVVVPPQTTVTSPLEQTQELLVAGDRNLGADRVVEAVKAYQQAAIVSHTLQGRHEEQNLVLWKLGKAYWRLAEKEGNPAYYGIAKAYWTFASRLPLPDPRCAQLVSTESACSK